MGLLDSIFGGGSGSADDPYADILTPAQRNHMQAQGLLAMAGAFAQAGMPSRLPVPFGSALGSAAAALGTGQEAGMTAAIANAYKAQQVRDLRAKAALQGKLSPIFQDLLDRIRAGQGGGLGAPALPQPAGAGTGGGGGGATPVGGGGGGGGLLSPDFSMGSDYASGLTPEPTERTSRFDTGLLNYPSDLSGGMRVGGQALAPRPDAGLGTATPSSDYAPGGDLYPFKQLGVVPGGTGGGAGAPAPVPEVTPTPGDTNGIDTRKRAALDAILAGMQTAQGGPSAGRLPQFAGPGAADAPAADAIPEGGGLLGVAPDLRAPIEANPFARAPSPGDPRGVVPLIRRAFLRQGIDPSVPIKVAGSEGLSSFQSTVPSAKGPGGREPSWGAFQLYTGGGLGNQFQKETGLDPSDPANEAATIDWVAKNVNRTGWSPWHGAKNVGVGDRTGLPGGDLPPPDQLIPSGPGAGGALPPVMQAQYRPQGGGLPAPSTLPPQAAPGAAPALGAGGKIPGLNMTPQELAVIDAMAESAGLGNPFKGLLDTYYKSPEYLRQKTETETKARTDIEDPINRRMKILDFTLDMRKNGFFIGDNGQVVADPEYDKIVGRRAEDAAQLKQKYDKQLKTFEEQIEIDKENRADKREAVTASVYGPNGQIVQQDMLRADKVKRLQSQSMNPGADYKPGDIVTKPLGSPPEGYEFRLTPQGALSTAPITGSPAATTKTELERKQAGSDLNLQISRDIIVQNANRIESLVENSNLPVTGFGGSWMSRLPGSASNDVRVLIETMKARSSLDALNAMRQASPTGGALGNVSNAEGDRLAAALSNLDQSQSKDQFLFNLRRTKEAYIDAVHGPGAYSKMSNEPVLKVPTTGMAPVAPDQHPAMRSQAMDAIAKGAPRAVVIKRLQDMGVSAEGL